MNGARAVVVRAGNGHVLAWASALDAAEAVDLGTTASPPEIAKLREAGCALVDGANGDPIRLAHRVHAADPTLQAVIVAPPETRPAIERAVLFTPGLGETWIITPDQVGPDVIERASAVTRQRRRFRATRAHLEHDLSSIEARPSRRAVISDAYLASLLAVLPDPILSVDAEGKVLSWNSAAERVLGHRRSRAIGRPLADLLVPDDPITLTRILKAASSSPSRGEIGFHRANGEIGTAEISVVPVEASGHSVRAVVLRDVTEDRSLQESLEEQAAELESQASALETSQLELENANDDLQRVNAELAARTEEAERARSEAESANRAKTDFLATMSHEIRTPINAIIGYTELLEMGLSGELTEQQSIQLGRIRSSSQHLLRLVEDILDLAKVEAGRIEIAQERAAAVNAISAALSLVVPLAVEKGVRIVDPCQGDLDIAYVGDEARVRQILANLLTNAVKFTEPGGEVRIACGTSSDPGPAVESLAGPRTFIRISDTGIGIDDEEIDRIFRPFEQVEKGHTRQKGGTGLGLTISRQLARLMGGDLTVQSEPGVGSSFTLWLPSESGPFEETVLAQVREDGPRGLATVGMAIVSSTETIVTAFRERLRSDSRIPSARALSDTELEDHVRTLLADVAQNLIAMEKSPRVPEHLLRDGGEIQRVISGLHGAQRARLGWSETALRQEFRILRDEVEKAARRSAAPIRDMEVALDMLGRFLEHAERVSLAGLRRAQIERAV
jgi:PAS domain S-box-containing protein